MGEEIVSVFDIGLARLQAVNIVLKEVNAWLERDGVHPPTCIIERATYFIMTPEEYHQMWKSWGFLDQRLIDEMHAIEDAAIRRVDPAWVRRETA